MELHTKRPGEGWDAEALHASERARVRSLIELLAEARINLREGIDESLLAEERSLEASFFDAAARRTAPAGRRIRPGAVRLEPWRARCAPCGIRGRSRALESCKPSLCRAGPSAAHQLEGDPEQVLDRETLLLEFELGEERSFVWAATSDTLTSHELPKRAVIEAAARRLYQAWSVGSGIDKAETARRARALSRMLLGPVADQLGDKRLAIVAEGALQYVPFAALPSPRGGATAVPLIATHEMVNLPSATTLAVLRREASGRSAPGWRVAVLADPVFDRRDSRVLGGSVLTGSAPNVVDDALTRSMQEQGSGDSSVSTPAGARLRPSSLRSPDPERASSPWTSRPIGRWRWARRCRAHASSISPPTVS